MGWWDSSVTGALWSSGKTPGYIAIGKWDTSVGRAQWDGGIVQWPKLYGMVGRLLAIVL